MAAISDPRSECERPYLEARSLRLKDRTPGFASPQTKPHRSVIETRGELDRTSPLQHNNQVKSIADNNLNIPPHAPVMMLPGAVLFPNALLPLFIFEPRYRAMLAHCLEQQRMFCVGHVRPGVEEVRSLADVYPVAGLGLVRACVGREDGTSHLVLQGLARVRLRGVVQSSPFQILEIQELPPKAVDLGATRELSAEVLELCSGMQPGVDAGDNLREQLANVADADALADIVAHTFLRDPEARQDVLEAVSVQERLEALIRHLRTETGQEL